MVFTINQLFTYLLTYLLINMLVYGAVVIPIEYTYYM